MEGDSQASSIKKLTKKQLKAQKFKDFKKDKLKDSQNKDQEVTEEAPKEDSDKPESTTKTEDVTKDESENKPKTDKKKQPNSEKKDSAKEPRKKFIVFVGNLPYACTKEDLEAHFKICGDIASTRFMTDKNTGKPKGFAFMEFKDSASLEKALKFHHSKFKFRFINVELSAGGGGSGENRKNKIKQKNERLNKEREGVFKNKIAPAKRARSDVEQDSNMPPKINSDRLKRMKNL